MNRKPAFQKQRIVTAQPGKHHRRSRHTRNKTSLMSSMVDITAKLHQVDDYQEKSQLNDKPLKQLTKTIQAYSSKRYFLVASRIKVPFNQISIKIKSRQLMNRLRRPLICCLKLKFKSSLRV